MPDRMIQTAPWPTILQELVDKLFDYQKGWTFKLIDREAPEDDPEAETGLHLRIGVWCSNSYHPHTCEHCHSLVTDYPVHHWFPVPIATYNEASWIDWLWKRIGDVDDHERNEKFKVRGLRPYAPNHGPGWNPYMRTVVSTPEDAATKYTGEKLEVLHK